MCLLQLLLNAKSKKATFLFNLPGVSSQNVKGETQRFPPSYEIKDLLCMNIVCYYGFKRINKYYDLAP